MENLLTLNEIAEKLRVSKHTIQAWISPSSPNHKPEFANMARHAGRKTVFLEEEIDTWLNQRKGALFSQSYIETSAYWREKFLASRGLLKGKIKTPEIIKISKKNFVSGKLALDYEPILFWLADTQEASEILNLVNKSEGLIIAIPIVWWLLRRVSKNTKQFELCKKFLIEDNIFELAPMNENSLKTSLELPPTAGELSIQSYACANSAGASSLLTCNPILLKKSGLQVCSI